ncbi:MAG: coiled-coil domain-containing protein [Planctomycetota bacterium]|jgi:hypothetical protein
MTPSRYSVAVAVIAAAIFTLSASAQKGDPAAAQAREEVGAQIEELGTTLKAAAMSGVISGEEAREIYNRVLGAAKASDVRQFGDGNAKAGDGNDPKTHVARLTAPRPERVQELLRPEFLRRDLPRLADALGFDRSQMMIVRVLFEDYSEAFELSSAPLREALSQYRGSGINAYIAFTLEDAGVRLDQAVENARRADRDEAMARMQETMARIDEERAGGSEKDRRRYEAWKESALAATSELDERLAAIRDRATRQLNDMSRDEAAIDADDLLHMATQLRTDRAQLRVDLIESIGLIATEEQRGEEDRVFDAVMDQIRIDMLLEQGRLGGESMNLWAALAEVSRDLEARGEDWVPGYAEEWLDARVPEIAARLDARTEAIIDREIAGLEFQAVRDRIAAANGESIFEIDERRVTAVISPYVTALRLEVEASVAVRDRLLALLEESTVALSDAYPESDLARQLASRQRDASLRRGFPAETRTRWAERAVAAALELEELDGDVLEALVELDTHVGAELDILRTSAIEKRIRRDPKLAREFIAAEFEGEEIDFDDDIWREVDYEAFVAVDERTETQLRTLLTPAQFEALPSRPGQWDELAKEPGMTKPASGKGPANGETRMGKPKERQ